ncbi:mutS protein homolog 5-like isoform X2 [Ischnura elegans]|uniref:mutS protein homolog 5-like isoform X2 n=1 Tax=Ischnura elegans TaxID=197161 RepID=UPI001ED8B74C|nr:mutS protein homolog 5-like isoform X2 [Ischnura elegans]
MDFEEDTTHSEISLATTVEAPFSASCRNYEDISFISEDRNNQTFALDSHRPEITSSANVNDLESETSEETLPETILSVFWRAGKLGAACYCMDTSEISVLPDTVDVNPEFNMLKCIYNQLKPSQVVTSARVTSKFLTALKTLLKLPRPEAQDESHNSNQCYEAKLFCLPGKDFYFDPCRRRVLGIHLPHEPKGLSEEEHNNYIHSLVDMSAETMVQALGALLIYLDRTWAEVNLQVGVRTPPVLDLTLITLDDIVIIDSASYEALQIFSQRSHPSNFKKWAPGSNKEGLSVFGIFNRCKSQQGCLRMREMFLHPSRKVETLNERLDVIDFCFKGRNSDTVKNFLDCLKNINSVTRIMTKLAVTQASIKEWKSLYKTIYNCILLGELCSAYKKEAKIFEKISDCATEDLQQVAHYIYSVMDFDESEAQNKFVVKMGVDEELDKLKQKHMGLSNLMSKVAEQELESLPPEVTECSLMYLPEIGYILCLPMWKENMEDTDFNIPGLEFKFKANRMAHYKSARCKEMDNALGDCSVQVMTHELRIMVRLIQFILEHLSPVIQLVKHSATLDCLIALATVARENGYVRPTLKDDERVIEIHGGRHLLQELCMDSFVPNDTFSSEKNDWGLMKVLTGPNASGKSVYMKQVALITFLAHIGSFVPAESAVIGIIDSIHTRITTTESISLQLSAFMIDLCQVSTAVNCSSPSSLVIIDEFGKGTTELDGLSLLTAVLEHFLSRGSNCPHVLVSTHFHNISMILASTPGLTYQTMDHMFEGDQIIYLFKLKNGSVNSSFAHQVAVCVGLNTRIINRSKQVQKKCESA